MSNLSIPNLPAADLPLLGNEITVISQGGETKKLPINNFPTPIEPVFTGLVANNTTMEDTTLILEYGVNIVATVTNVDYACRLPIPTTGKRLTVINNSLIQLFLYPDYNEGVAGKINNGAVGAPAIIPPNGQAYDFICVDNPLPGAWIWSPPAIAQYDSGDITGTTTGVNNVIVAVQTGISNVTNTPTINGGIVGASPSNNTPISPLGYNYFLFANDAYFKPIGVGSNWSSITKVKVYTNISSNLGGAAIPIFSINGASGLNKYILGSDPTDFNNYLGSGTGGFQYLLAELNLVVPGVVPAPGVTANVGDAGTLYGIFTLGVDYIFPQPGSGVATSFVGDRYVGVGIFNGSEPCDDYQSLYISGNLKVGQVAVGVKFRFFFEYM
jgi:hypothetical protein